MIEFDKVDYLDLTAKLRDEPVAVYKSHHAIDRELHFAEYQRHFWWTFFEPNTMARVGEMGCIINLNESNLEFYMKNVAHPLGFKINKKIEDAKQVI